MFSAFAYRIWHVLALYGTLDLKGNFWPETFDLQPKDCLYLYL